MDTSALSVQNAVCCYDTGIIQQENDGPKKQMPTALPTTESDKSIRAYSVTPNPIKSTNDSVKVVSFKEVMENFVNEHGSYGDTNHIAREYIDRANKEIVKPNNGGWLFVELSFETAMKVLLPGHTHDGEWNTLLPYPGLTAKDAAGFYNTLWSEEDKINSPLCTGSLNYHLKNLNAKPIFLTVEPINERFDYGRIINYPRLSKGRLVHLDGLHRLVALAILDNPESTISAYIACKETPKEIDGLGLIGRDGIQYPESVRSQPKNQPEKPTPQGFSHRAYIKDLPAVSKGCGDDYTSEVPLKLVRHRHTSLMPTLRGFLCEIL